MKKLKNLIPVFLIIFLFGTTAPISSAASKTFAPLQQMVTSPNLGVTFGQLQKSKLDVMVASGAATKRTIRLLDASGKIIATKILAKNQSSILIRFDLKALADGVYQVQVTDGKNTQQQPFELKTRPSQAATQQLSLG